MTKAGWLAMVFGSSLAMACSSGAPAESSADQTQAMCAASSDSCGPNGYPTPPPRTTGTRTLGGCVGKPGNVTSTAINNAVANPVSGWTPKDTSNPVWQFEDYIVRHGFVGATDQMYYIAPNGTTGQSWLGLQISVDAYNSEAADGYVQSQSPVFPVLSHVVECDYTTSYTDPDTGEYVSTTTTTYWSMHDPGGCSKTSCAGYATTHAF